MESDTQNIVLISYFAVICIDDIPNLAFVLLIKKCLFKIQYDINYKLKLDPTY